ncbi:MAG: hypothetical protein IT538_14575 [Variibacter sp.]|nr:hypothetical protein [Variibacter sp.]
MLERQYVVSEEPQGWRLLLDAESLGLFATKQDAFAAAVEAARRSRANGHYACVKLRYRDVALPD